MMAVAVMDANVEFVDVKNDRWGYTKYIRRAEKARVFEVS
jgi:hypothetical protein